VASTGELLLRLPRAVNRVAARYSGPSKQERARLARQPADWPLTCYLVCGTPRSGTTYLAGLLSSTGLVGHPSEYFAWQNEPPWAERRFGAYVAHVKRLRARNGVFGSKLFWPHLERLLPRLRALAPSGFRHEERKLLEWAFPSLSYVWLRRDDVVAQAVSWWKADQTQLWASDQLRGAARAPSFDFEAIDELVVRATLRNEAWRGWFAEQGIEPLAIEYEQLAADPVAVTGGVLRFLGVVVPDPVTVESDLERQADGVNEEWIARYRELAERMGLERPLAVTAA
jgi:LPS sulfotransferase NodH